MEIKIKNKYEEWLLKATEDKDVENELKTLNKEEDIENRFNSSMDFGTAGLRAVIGAGTNRINIYTVRKITQAVASYYKSLNPNASFAVAYDSRNKSELFAKTTASVLASNGIKVYMFKALMPVPSLSYMVRHLKCDGGVMITASHNPAKYNGYKVYGKDGCQVDPNVAKLIKNNMNQINEFDDVKDYGFQNLVIKHQIEYIDESDINDYINDTLKLSILGSGKKENCKVVYSPLNGAGIKCVPEVLKRDGFEVYIVKEQEHPNGNFPTCPKPNPELHEVFDLPLKLAKEVDAEIVVCTDPDSDRIGFASKEKDGYFLPNGNEIGILLFDYICNAKLKNGKMPSNPAMVKTIVTTDMFGPIASHYGVEIRECLVGFKCIGEQMALLEKEGREKDFLLGLEESYGYLTRTDVRDKDAVNAALLICEMAYFYKSQGVSIKERLIELYNEYGYFKNALVPYEFDCTDGQKIISKIMDNVRNNYILKFLPGRVLKTYDFKEGKIFSPYGGCEKLNMGSSNVLKIVFQDGNSLTIRPSGTEPKIKFYFSVKGESLEDAEKICSDMEQYVDKFVKYVEEK